MRNFIYTLLLLLSFNTALATHNRSGSITYRHVSGYTYAFTVTTCTKSSSEADRPQLEINWGDGTSDTIDRDPNIDFNFAYDVQINKYYGTHTFTGPANYIVSVEDPNRNAGVLNITNSVDKVFCIQTELVISPFIGNPNNSLVIEDCPCPEFACLQKKYCYNLSAYDPDGDSLSYSLVPCRGEDCLEMSIPEIYQYPDDVGGGIMTIDPVSGTLCWDAPQFQGEFNLAIKIKEWRNGFYIGSVIQDMQLTVRSCNNDPPIIDEVADTCVFAGTNVNIPFVAHDPNAGDIVTIRGTGSIFNVGNNPAVFVDSSSADTVVGYFQWDPECNEATGSYYTVIIHAEDNDPGVPLEDLSTFRIKVNVPPVQNVSVTPAGNAMTITWDPSSCTNVDHYNIYKQLDSITANETCCNNNAAIGLGYQLVGTATDTFFVDNNGLIVGNDYCYLVTVVTNKGIESCLSNVDCAHLNFEIPILTHVSINSTDVSNGTDTVKWSYPKELNTTIFPGPYHYQLYRQTGYQGGVETLVLTTTQQASIANPDTTFEDTGLNTEANAYTYRLELYSNNLLVGTSLTASSIYLTLTPNDNQLALSWVEDIPWVNNSYEIYRETSPGSTIFNLIGTTNSIGYIDTGLINGSSYCYKIKTIGGYSSPGIVSPIENWSQEVCGIPVDLTPPCPPELYIDGDCDLEETYLSWTNPNNSCADDVTRYNLYFAPFEDSTLTLLTSFGSDLDTFFVHSDRGSIAGCYYVTALDSIQYNNESEPSNIACIDNCDGYYELPNVFTPDGSGVNDLYHPLLPYKFVDHIDLRVFNRWGDLVYETTNPVINWDGKNLDGKTLNDGVYFYEVTVYEIKLSGLVPRSFQGNITIIHSQH
ncbi:MAG: gliding motility-associated C-terminal domain-containing protein [Crocinitomicaceae bacterium]|nr:gliding motility-associated C-terminal domain-containing protein [Crocinitomicaceae bacterium]